MIHSGHGLLLCLLRIQSGNMLYGIRFLAVSPGTRRISLRNDRLIRGVPGLQGSRTAVRPMVKESARRGAGYWGSPLADATGTVALQPNPIGILKKDPPRVGPWTVRNNPVILKVDVQGAEFPFGLLDVCQGGHVKGQVMEAGLVRCKAAVALLPEGQEQSGPVA
jgi:hypothetical protein